MVFFSATLHSLQPSPACDLWKFSAHSSPGLKLCLPRAVPCCTWAASRLHQSGTPEDWNQQDTELRVQTQTQTQWCRHESARTVTGPPSPKLCRQQAGPQEGRWEWVPVRKPAGSRPKKGRVSSPSLRAGEDPCAGSALRQRRPPHSAFLLHPGGGLLAWEPP